MRRILIVTLLALATAPAAAHAAVPANAEYSEDYFETADGVTLHADILRPKGLPKDAKTPVILTVSPYTNHIGSQSAIGEDFNPAGNRPSERFKDFYEGAKLFDRGYTYVMVDLRGFGGSGGCNDWGGPGEQEDVRAAVEWAASQPWSTGKVGMYGKSYDGWTGLMGLVQKPKGLAAVVAMEPVYDGYRYLYTNGIRFVNSFATGASFQLIDATPGSLAVTPQYQLNGTGPNAACYVLNYGQQQLDDAADPFWKARELIPRAKGADVPLFMTQGFLEDNTKPDGAWDFFNSVTGPKRGWFGMFQHVRPTDKNPNGTPIMGRDPQIWLDEVMRFYDHYVRDVPLTDANVAADPAVEVQTSDGTWRADTAWPPADSKVYSVQLKPGSYTDDGNNNGSSTGAGNGLWTISPQLANRAHLSGVSYVTVDAAPMVPRSNLVANIYDLDATGSAIVVSRGAVLLREGGRHTFELYGNDWVFEPGHRIGVLISSSNADWWTHAPTNGRVDVTSARIQMPFLEFERVGDLPGKRGDALPAWRAATFAVPADVIAAATDPLFALPPKLLPKPLAAPKAAATDRRPRLLARIAARGKRVVVYGNAPTGAKLTVALRRGTRTVARRRTTAKVGAFRVTFRVGKRGRYTARVSARAGSRTLRARTRSTRVR